MSKRAWAVLAVIVVVIVVMTVIALSPGALSAGTR